MFGFHAVSEAAFSSFAGAIHTAEASLGNEFGFDDGFTAGFEVEPAVLNASATMIWAGSSALVKGFGLSADAALLSDLSLGRPKPGTASLQSDSIFSSKGVLISVGKANLAGGGRLSVYGGIAELSIVLYIDRERGIVNYLDRESDFTLYIDRELNQTLSIDQGSSRTSYIDKELLMEI